jgi:hypothetical protein
VFKQVIPARAAVNLFQIGWAILFKGGPLVPEMEKCSSPKKDFVSLDTTSA